MGKIQIPRFTWGGFSPVLAEDFCCSHIFPQILLKGDGLLWVLHHSPVGGCAEQPKSFLLVYTGRGLYVCAASRTAWMFHGIHGCEENWENWLAEAGHKPRSGQVTPWHLPGPAPAWAQDQGTAEGSQILGSVLGSSFQERPGGAGACPELGKGLEKS